MKFVDIKDDKIFQKVFGDASKPEAVMSFINSVLGFEGEDKIIFVKIIPPYKYFSERAGKSTFIDVVAKDKNLLEYTA